MFWPSIAGSVEARWNQPLRPGSFQAKQGGRGTDHRHLRPLCACGGRRCDGRAAEKRDELAPIRPIQIIRSHLPGPRTTGYRIHEGQSVVSERLRD